MSKLSPHMFQILLSKKDDKARRAHCKHFVTAMGGTVAQYMEQYTAQKKDHDAAALVKTTDDTLAKLCASLPKSVVKALTLAAQSGRPFVTFGVDLSEKDDKGNVVPSFTAVCRDTLFAKKGSKSTRYRYAFDGQWWKRKKCKTLLKELGKTDDRHAAMAREACEKDDKEREENKEQGGKGTVRGVYKVLEQDYPALFMRFERQDDTLPMPANAK